jgi:transcriptional regulator with XRE-family HTH domain
VSAYQHEREHLAGALREMRVRAGLSGAELARRLGWAQSKISKIESMRQLPTDEDIAAWTAATGAAAEAPALMERLRGARVEYAGVKEAFAREGAAGVQQDLLELEDRSARIAEFQPGLIPGPLQTADYSRAILHLPCGPESFGRSEDDIEGMVAARLQRQRVLYDSTKQITMIMLEGALRSRVVPTPVLAAQLDRLIDLAALPTAGVGIVAFDSPLRIFPLTGFRLYDDLVIIEAIVGEQQLSEPDEVKRYENYLALLRETASTGPDAVAVIRRAIAALSV